MLIEYPNVDMMNCRMLAVFCNNHALSIHLFLKYCTSVEGIKCYFCSIPFNLFRNPSIPSTCCAHVSKTVAMKSNWILVNFFSLLHRKSNSRFILFDCYEAETLLQCKAKLSWSKLRERSVYLYLYLGIYDFQWSWKSTNYSTKLTNTHKNIAVPSFHLCWLCISAEQ